MNKNDFRVQFPLWNIALFTILMIYSYGVVYCVDMLVSDLDGVFSFEKDEIIINWSLPGLLSLLIGIVSLVTFFIAYFKKLKGHNRKFPNQKMKAFTFIALGEFLEDDELFNEITRNATKKVYVFYSQALPLIVLLMFFPINRYIFIVTIFLALIIHNAIYYREIRKYI